MAEEVWPLVQREAIDSIQQLSRRTQFGVSTYAGAQPDSYSSTMKRATAANKQAVVEWILGIQAVEVDLPHGGCVDGAMDAAFRMLRNTIPRTRIHKRAIVVGMEPEPKCDGHILDIESISVMNTQRVVVDTVFVEAENFPALTTWGVAIDWWQDLADLNGGTYSVLSE